MSGSSDQRDFKQRNHWNDGGHYDADGYYVYPDGSYFDLQDVFHSTPAPLSLASLRDIQARTPGIVGFDGKGEFSLGTWLELLECADTRASDHMRIKWAVEKITAPEVVFRILAFHRRCIAEPLVDGASKWTAFKKFILGDQDRAIKMAWQTGLSQGNMDVDSYWLHFDNLVHQCRGNSDICLSENNVRDKFLRGLKPELRQACAIVDARTAHDLMLAAKRYERNKLNDCKVTVADVPEGPVCKVKRRHPRAHSKPTKRVKVPPRCWDFDAGHCSYGRDCKFLHTS